MMEEAWNRAKTRLSQKIPDHSFTLWIDPLEFSQMRGEEVVLGCPTVFFKKWVCCYYLELIEAEMENVCGCPCHIQFEVSNGNTDNGRAEPEEEQLLLPHVEDHQHLLPPFHMDYTFDQFVVGMCNDFAYNAALALACEDNIGHAPLYLLSKTGLGKSHLSQAVGNHILQKNSGVRVCYTTAEEFTNAMVHALRNDKIEGFKDKFRRQCDVLLLEDVQFLSGKTKTQEELAYTLDALLDSKKKLIFTGTYLPGDIPKMDEKLASRLSSGVISNINSPDFQTRTQILKKKAAVKKVDIPEEVVEFLASELAQNVRQLERRVKSAAS